MEDLDGWQVYLEEPVKTTYKGIDVYKLTHWVQGPVMLQALNILENVDLDALGYNSAGYIHALYQAMNLAFADRDFYYGDPYSAARGADRGPAVEGIRAGSRFEQIDWKKNNADAKPGDPYPFQEGENPFLELLEGWTPIPPAAEAEGEEGWQQTFLLSDDEAFIAGTTSIQAADAEGWVVSVTPSGGWIPAFIAGETGIGLSQRMQSFVLDERMNPYNVLEPGQAAARDADTRHGAQGRQALSLVRGPGRRHPGSEPAAVLPQRRRVRHERAAGGRGRQHQQLPDAVFVRRSQGRAGSAALSATTCPLGAGRSWARWAIDVETRRSYIGADHRDLLRSRARHDVGRGERLRRGLRHRLVRGRGCTNLLRYVLLRPSRRTGCTPSSASGTSLVSPHILGLLPGREPGSARTCPDLRRYATSGLLDVRGVRLRRPSVAVPCISGHLRPSASRDGEGAG